MLCRLSIFAEVKCEHGAVLTACLRALCNHAVLTRYAGTLVIAALLTCSGVTVAESAGENTEVIIDNRETTIAGTLALPPVAQTNALVIMLSGSGPQGRDETLHGFSVFFHLAQHLSAQGIASFRFDDRGVGNSTGNFNKSTLADHANDVIAILDYFSRRTEHRFERFILLGHSQGGIVASRVATTRRDVAKVILMAAPAVPLIDIVLYQVRHEYSQLPVNKAVVEEGVSAHNRLMWAIQKNKPLAVELRHFEQTMFALHSASVAIDTPTSAKQEYVARQVREYRDIYALPSLTSFLYHDPAKDLQNITVPVLGLFGGKDLQVTIQQNKDIMEEALLRAGTDYQFVTFEQANHNFQPAKSGERNEYSTLDKQFVAGFLQTISSWILQD